MGNDPTGTAFVIPRRAVLGGTLAVSVTAGVGGKAAASGGRRLRMATSWPKGSAGAGRFAERFAELVGEFSGGELQVEVFAAGELVPAFEVFDAVSQGTVPMGHSASLFWQGKIPAAAFFTAVPFGLTPVAHEAWLREGDGQRLWEDLYAPFGLIPMTAGNTGPGMAGWFNRPLTSIDDVVGLKIRIAGMGAEIWNAMGAVAVSLAPGDIVSALRSGVIDAAEFTSPEGDAGLGLPKAATVYHHPGFHEPNGSSELLVNARTWAGLDVDQRRAIRRAASLVSLESIVTSWHRGARVLASMEPRFGVTVAPLPGDILTRARVLAADVLAARADQDPSFARVWESYRQALALATHRVPVIDQDA